MKETGGGQRIAQDSREREREKEILRPTAPTAGKNGGGFEEDGATLRSVWWIPTEPNKHAHFAIMPKELARRCILLGSKAGDMILDPFAGVGTTGLVASRLGRNFVGIELNPEYAKDAESRIIADAPLFHQDAFRIRSVVAGDIVIHANEK